VSLTTRVLIGLALGLAAGVAIASSGSSELAGMVRFVEPLGALFINAIRMTVVPLIVSTLIVGVAGAPSARSVGRLGGRALALFVAFLAITAVATALIAPPLVNQLTIAPEAVAAMRASAAQAASAAAESARKVPTFAQWLVSLVPDNPVRAAADGTIVPLIVFAVAFGVALTSLDAARRAPVVAFFQGVADAMLALVRWVLDLAPIGVFALALPLATRVGLAAAGALAFYVALVVALNVATIVLLLYPAAIVLGRVPLRRFVRAALPAQVVAFSSRSSLAALPAMIEGATDRLGISRETTGFFLPLAASIFRVGAVVGQIVGVLFIARLYGVEIYTARVATVALTSVLTSFSVPGVPGGSILVMVPVMIAAGVPVEGIGVLLGVDTIPDMFRTTANVTGHMAAVTMTGNRAIESQHQTAM
jgi:Na+/H+-dicarboxylate symporter